MKRSDLPFGSEFSPSQINLSEVLDIAQKHSGDWRAIEDEIRKKYFDSHATSDYNRRKLANNCKLGMIAYGVLTREGALTEMGLELLALKAKPAKLYEQLARHILLALQGLPLLQTVQDIQSHGEEVSLNKLREWLSERGIHFPSGGKHPSIMRLWLAKAGVVGLKSWDVDKKRLKEVLGLPMETLDQLSMLTVEQRAFLKTMANMGLEKGHVSSDIAKLAAATYGVKFDEKNLPKQVLYPLEDEGFLKMERGTKEIGRGAKPFRIKACERVRTDFLQPILESIESQARPDLRPLLRKSMKDILSEVRSSNRHVKGLALEALAFHLMRLIDLKYVATRLRGDATGGAEVDLVFEGARLLFSRWQVQCKNTASVSLDDVAKEVGLTIQLKSNVVTVVSTGTISKEARRYAQDVMRTTNLNVVLLDKADLQKIEQQPSHIAEALAREAERAMEIKKLEMP
jgi:site-specific DNA-methyltransferase (cytosine-N4-specific)